MPHLNLDGAADDLSPLEALARESVLDPSFDEAFDRVIRLAATAIRAPFAALCFQAGGGRLVRRIIGFAAADAAGAATLAEAFSLRVRTAGSPVVLDDLCGGPEGLPPADARRGLEVAAGAGAPIVDADGSAIGALCVFDRQRRAWSEADLEILQDLAAAATSSVRLSRLLREMALFRRIAHRMPGALWVTDRDLRITAAYGGALEIDADSSVGATIEELAQAVAPDSSAVARHREALRGTASSYEHVGDGRAYQVSVAPLRTPDGDVAGVMGAAIEITELKRVAEAHRELADEYRSLVEEALVGVYLIQDERLVYVNDRAAAMFGLTRDEALALPSFLELVGETDRAVVAAHVRRWLSSDVRTLEYSFQARRKGGDPVVVDARGARTEYQGRPAIIGTMLDATERARVESASRQASRLEAVGRLAGSVAQEYNNLLTALVGHVDLLLEESALDEAARRHVGEIRAAAARATALTRQLLTFSGGQVVRPAVHDLNAIVEGIEEVLRRFLGPEIDLVLGLDRRIGPVLVDAGLIEEAVLKLASNARDAMPDGGRLTIETSRVARPDPLAGAPAGCHVLLSVRDSGPGTDHEIQAHLFEPVFGTTTRRRGGGFGLATVYGIVKQSGGQIVGDTDAEGGSHFRVYLPEAPAGKGREASVTPGRAAGLRTILVVDDEEAVRKLVQSILTRQGYRVIDTGRPLEALELVAEHKDALELVITDLMMPELHGQDLAAHVRELAPAVPIIYISGYTDRPGILRQAGIQPQAFLQKPFTPETLTRVVRDVLTRVPGG